MSGPKLVIELDGGLVSHIYADGIDLTHVTAVVIDFDIEGADLEDIHPYGGSDVYVSPRDIVNADDDDSRNLRQAYDSWRLS